MSEEFSSGKGLTALMFSLTTCFYFLGGLITGRLADRFGPRRGVRRSYQHGNRSLPHVSRASDLGWIHHLWRWSRHSYGMWIRADGCDGWRMVQQTPNVGTRNCGVGHRRRNTRLCPACGITYRSVRMENDVRGVCNWRYGGSSHCIGWSGDATSCWRWGRGSASDARSRPTVYHPVFRAAHYNDGAVCPVVFIKTYATDRGVPSARAAALIGLIGASSIVGRLGLGALGAKVGPIRLMQAAFGVMASSHAIWLVADGRYGVLVLFAVVLGVGYGGFIALSPAAVAVMFGTNGMATILGATYTGAGIAGSSGRHLLGRLSTLRF